MDRNEQTQALPAPFTITNPDTSSFTLGSGGRCRWAPPGQDPLNRRPQSATSWSQVELQRRPSHPGNPGAPFAQGFRSGCKAPQAPPAKVWPGPRNPGPREGATAAPPRTHLQAWPSPAVASAVKFFLFEGIPCVGDPSPFLGTGGSGGKM